MDQIEIWKEIWWQMYGRMEDKEEVKGKQIGKIKDSNHKLAYEKNSTKEDKRRCLIVDGAWKKVMQGTNEEWEAAYG